MVSEFERSVCKIMVESVNVGIDLNDKEKMHCYMHIGRGRVLI